MSASEHSWKIALPWLSASAHLLQLWKVRTILLGLGQLPGPRTTRSGPRKRGSASVPILWEEGCVRKQKSWKLLESRQSKLRLSLRDVSRKKLIWKKNYPGTKEAPARPLIPHTKVFL